MAVDVSDALARAAAEELRRLSEAWSTTTAERTWHLAQVGGSVARCEEHLKREGFASWYPMASVHRAVAKRKLSHAQRESGYIREVIEPLFRGYLFVSMDIEQDRWRDTFRVAGVYGLACKGDMPYRVPDAVMVRLQARAEEGNGVVLGSTPIAELLCVGELVRVTDGPFRSFNATVEEVLPNDRIKALINIFGRGTPLELDRLQVEKL